MNSRSDQVARRRIIQLWGSEPFCMPTDPKAFLRQLEGGEKNATEKQTPRTIPELEIWSQLDEATPFRRSTKGTA